MSFIFKPYLQINIQHNLMCMYNTSFIILQFQSHIIMHFYMTSVMCFFRTEHILQQNEILLQHTTTKYKMTDLTKITLSLYVWHLLILKKSKFWVKEQRTQCSRSLFSSQVFRRFGVKYGSESLFLPIPFIRPF